MINQLCLNIHFAALMIFFHRKSMKLYSQALMYSKKSNFPFLVSYFTVMSRAISFARAISVVEIARRHIARNALGEENETR